MFVRSLLFSAFFFWLILFCSLGLLCELIIITLIYIKERGNITAFGRHESYKYLANTQLQGINNADMQAHLFSSRKQRLNAIMKTQLSANNKALATNALVVSVVTYSLRIFKWTATDLEFLNTKLNKAPSPPSQSMQRTLPCPPRSLGWRVRRKTKSWRADQSSTLVLLR